MRRRVFFWFFISIFIVLCLKYLLPVIYLKYIRSSSNAQDNPLLENQFKILPNNHCEPKKNVLFIKGDRMGSLDIQNIFFHYGSRNDLDTTLARIKKSYKETQTSQRLQSPVSLNAQYHSETLFSIRSFISIQSAKDNYKKMKSILPRNTIYLTDLKDPVSLTESLFKHASGQGANRMKNTTDLLQKFFFRFYNGSNNSTPFIHRKLHGFGQNQMSFELGLLVQHFNKQDLIQSFIKMIDSRFHLILLEDRLEESLIHLQNLLCWPLDDILVFRDNYRNRHLAGNLSSNLVDKIRLYNQADVLLYKYFDEKLTRQTTALGTNETAEKIASLQQNIQLMYDYCLTKLSPEKPLDPSNFTWIDYSNVRPQINNSMTRRCDLLISWKVPIIHSSVTITIYKFQMHR